MVINNTCESCLHFNSKIGYCNLLLIAVKEGVAIITTPLIMQAVGEKLKADAVYAYPLTHKDFGCILHEILESNEYIN